MFKSAEETDWESSSDQQIWFERYTTDTNGLKFSQFQSFLKETLYSHFARIPSKDEDNPAKFSYQQELQLFKMFDTKNDHVIDKDEFENLCRNWLAKTYEPSCALVVVDVQNDFIDGSLALINGPAGEDGADVVPVINKMVSRCKFDIVAYTLDWHPSDHIGFYSNLHLRKYRVKQQAKEESSDQKETVAIFDRNLCTESGDAKSDVNGSQEEPEAIQQACIESENKFKLKKLATKVKVFDTVLFDEGRIEQKLWPVHCVQNSWGAQLHPKLHQVPGALYIEKGTLPNVDAYSAFWDNMHLNETGLRHELTSRKISDVFFCGLALDYCVAASALDSIKAGFVTFVIDDACRGIDREEIFRRKEEMMESGILIVDSHTVESYLSCNNKLKLVGQDEPKDCVGTNSDCNSGQWNCETNSPSSKLSSQRNHLSILASNPLVDVNSQSREEKVKFDRSLIVSICYKRAVAAASGLY